jgi:hypothetical protein
MIYRNTIDEWYPKPNTKHNTTPEGRNDKTANKLVKLGKNLMTYISLLKFKSVE